MRLFVCGLAIPAKDVNFFNTNSSTHIPQGQRHVGGWTSTALFCNMILWRRRDKGRRGEERREREWVKCFMKRSRDVMTRVDAVARDRGEPVCFLNADRNSLVPQFKEKLATYIHDAKLPSSHTATRCMTGRWRRRLWRTS